MSTDPRNLKIRIRMSGPASAPVAEIPVTTDASPRAAVFIAAGVVAVLLAGWGLWAALAKRNDDSPAPVATTIPLSADESPSVTATPPAQPAKVAPSPAAHKIPAAPQSHPPGKASGVASGSNLVVRAVVSDKMRNRQPVTVLGGAIPASDTTKRLHFFTEVNDVGSRHFTHRWEYRGKPVAQIKFKPSGKNWSAASSKQIPNHMQGEWRVVLADDQARDLSSVDFVYGTNAAPEN